MKYNGGASYLQEHFAAGLSTSRIRHEYRPGGSA